ncbi:hypothetical protein Pelo_5129 [Pelomyxa schiedti]|nr:hypothetical protein Pelo_5129 [Pelomyxa schiedti]
MMQQQQYTTEQQQSLQLLVGLLSADNPTRSAAEIELNRLKQTAPDALVLGLLSTALVLLSPPSALLLAPSGATEALSGGAGTSEAQYIQMVATAGTWRQMCVTLLRPMLIAGDHSKHRESVWNSLALPTRQQVKVSAVTKLK